MSTSEAGRGVESSCESDLAASAGCGRGCLCKLKCEGVCVQVSGAVWPVGAICWLDTREPCANDSVLPTDACVGCGE